MDIEKIREKFIKARTTVRMRFVDWRDTFEKEFEEALAELSGTIDEKPEFGHKIKWCGFEKVCEKCGMSSHGGVFTKEQKMTENTVANLLCFLIDNYENTPLNENQIQLIGVEFLKSKYNQALAELEPLEIQTKANHGHHLCSVCGSYISKDEKVVIGIIHAGCHRKQPEAKDKRIDSQHKALKAIWPFIEEDFPNGTGNNHGTCATLDYLEAARKVKQALAELTEKKV